MLLNFFLAAAGLIAGAEAPATPLGRTVRVASLQVTPLRIVEDSRCPMNARCVWAGRIVVRTRIRGGRWARTLDLTLGKAQPVADGAITLVSATPERMAGSGRRPLPYRFAFSFDGGY